MLYQESFNIHLFAIHVAMDIKKEIPPVVISHFAISFAFFQISLSNFAGAKMKYVEAVGT